MPGLKKLTELELGLKIQTGAHSSVRSALITCIIQLRVPPDIELTNRFILSIF